VLGQLVADAVEKVGAEGVVSLEDAKGTETSLEVVEGMSFDRGFLSPYFAEAGCLDRNRRQCAAHAIDDQRRERFGLDILRDDHERRDWSHYLEPTTLDA
jgi:hypothetical protein